MKKMVKPKNENDKNWGSQEAIATTAVHVNEAHGEGGGQRCTRSVAHTNCCSNPPVTRVIL